MSGGETGQLHHHVPDPARPQIFNLQVLRSHCRTRGSGGDGNEGDKMGGARGPS